ncbi:hypothetical protein GCM10007916_03890 [Psychromonas marina]|uniref:Uncharacterized protein n=1 Tax=Psychromonas marina TaxID=88364 RepID=A0ABQ6DW99_9GAMM|nr:hypothetical protein [Psychromonas marina]GLS89322.1 hypothetical protein GCM10007916_03890 [Psychromonas marina]
MHKLINRIAIIALIVIAGWYFLQSKINSPVECEKAAGVWNENAETCEQSTAQKIYEDISSAYPMTMDYPETDFEVSIDKIEKINEIHYLRGHYEKVLQEPQGEKEGIYERASLYLNMSKMVILNEPESGLVHYTAPFITNTAGGAVYVYVGLFSYDMKSHQSEHLDSVLLGERVRRENITQIKDHLQVDFRSYAEKQDFLEFPSETSAIYLKVVNDFSKFEQVQRMHSSWDENSDGINDCESDGSCDHTFDYTLPRIEEI